MRQPHFRRVIVPRAPAANGRLRVLVPSLALVALLTLADRGTFESTAAAAEPQGGQVSTAILAIAAARGSAPATLPRGPFADEFVITGAEQGEPGESYVPAGGDGTFGLPSPIFGLDVVDGVEVADVDRDDDLDFLIAEGRSGDVFLYRNLGQGSFAPRTRRGRREHGVLHKPPDCGLQRRRADGLRRW